MEKDAKQTLLELIENREFQIDKWYRKPFEKFKIISTTEKGNIAEDFLIKLLKKCGKEVSRPKNRKGHYDVLMNKSIGFEVKLATQDSNGNFQFNGIRYNTKYTHLFCLGVTPEKLYYLIIEKSNLINNYTLVSMAKGSNSSFKLTQTTKTLKEFSTFESDINKL